jgi:hypothetical protein
MPEHHSPCGILGRLCQSSDTAWGTASWLSLLGEQRGTAASIAAGSMQRVRVSWVLQPESVQGGSVQQVHQESEVARERLACLT